MFFHRILNMCYIYVYINRYVWIYGYDDISEVRERRVERLGEDVCKKI